MDGSTLDSDAGRRTADCVRAAGSGQLKAGRQNRSRTRRTGCGGARWQRCSNGLGSRSARSMLSTLAAPGGQRAAGAGDRAGGPAREVAVVKGLRALLRQE
jgi:hypothetical protein